MHDLQRSKGSPTFQLTALCRWRRADRLCDQGSACGRSEAFPARAVGSHLLYEHHLPPCDRERKFQSQDEGIVDSRELARNLIPKPVLASSKPAIASRLSPSNGPSPGAPGLSKQRDA